MSEPSFALLKIIKLKVMHYFIIDSINIIKSFIDVEFKNVMKLFKDYTKELFLFSVINTTLASDTPLRFRKKLL